MISLKPTVIALAGNQNSGKSTLFNLMTGDTAQVGNWPGVTVDLRTGRAGESVTLVDLPGVYALDACSPEEEIAEGFLRSGHADAIISVADGTCLARSLYLTLQLAELHKPMILVISMMDEVRRRGGRIDAARLSACFGIPVVLLSCRSGEGLAELREMLYSSCTLPSVPLFPGDSAEAAAARYQYIDSILTHCIVSPCKDDRLSDRLDSIMLHPVFSVVALLILSLATIALVCGEPVQRIMSLMDALVGRATDLACVWMAAARVFPWLQRLVLEGLLPGIGSILSFTPMMLILFLWMTLLENSGCMARISFLLEKPMRLIGLSGKSIFPLLMGCGCTVTATLSARSIPDKGERRRTICLMPFVPCSAKLPVCFMIAARYFPQQTPLVLGCVTAGLLLLACCMGLWFRKADPAGDAPLLLEMPPWRMPALRGVIRSCLHHMAEFLRRVMSVILLSSAAVWMLGAYTPGFTPAIHASESMLGRLSGGIAPLLRPAGLDSQGIAAALLTGLLAKENIISTLCIFAGGLSSDLFSSAASAISFVVFIMLYSPCMAALGAVAAEEGRGTAARMAVRQTCLAWIVSVCIHYLVRLCMP